MRILKPGGQVYCLIPFIFGFHASPYDYQRYTTEGMKVLFNDFDIMKVEAESGPTSALLAIAHEWLAIVFSFGHTKLQALLSVFFMVILSPLKFLDAVLIKHPSSKIITANTSILAKKPLKK